jgi:hypothetical protein
MHSILGPGSVGETIVPVTVAMIARPPRRRLPGTPGSRSTQAAGPGDSHPSRTCLGPRRAISGMSSRRAGRINMTGRLSPPGCRVPGAGYRCARSRVPGTRSWVPGARYQHITPTDEASSTPTHELRDTPPMGCVRSTSTRIEIQLSIDRAAPGRFPQGGVMVGSGRLEAQPRRWGYWSVRSEI